MMVWMLALSAWAEEGESGRYQLADSPSEVQQFKDAAIERTLSSMSFAVRLVAASRLDAAVTACSGYVIASGAAVMEVTCDDRPTVSLQLDGTPTRYTSDKGIDYVVTASRSGDRVTAEFQGPDASQTTVYAFQGDRLTVQRTIQSPHFGEPLSWTNNYQR